MTIDWEMVGVIITAVIAVCGALTYIITKAFQFGEIKQQIAGLQESLVGVLNSVNGLQEKVSRIENKISEHSVLLNSVSGLSARMSQTEGKLIEQAEAIATIRGMLAIESRAFDSALSKRHSPKALNELGVKLFKEMNGQELLEKNREELFHRIDKEQPKSKLDIEQAAFIVCCVMANQDPFIPVRDFVYSCPTQTTPDGKPYEVDLQSACYILSLPLRDMYIASKGL